MTCIIVIMRLTTFSVFEWLCTKKENKNINKMLHYVEGDKEILLASIAKLCNRMHHYNSLKLTYYIDLRAWRN